MTTHFYTSTIIQDVTPEHDHLAQPIINWDFNGPISENNYASSKKPLYTISGLWMEKYLSHTSELWCTGFNIPDEGLPVVGIEFSLNMKRFARIEDLRIQLTLNNEQIGNNMASLIDPVQVNMYTGDNSPLLPVIGDSHIYGNSTDLWGTTGLTSTDIADPTFGIIISFRSNQVYPHRDFAEVNQIALRITYG